MINKMKLCGIVLFINTFGIAMISSFAVSNEVDRAQPVPNDIATNVLFTATLSTNRLFSTETLVLTAVLKNTSTNVIQIGLVDGPIDCEVMVRSESGEEVPQTLFAKKTAKAASRCGGFVRKILPNQSYTYNLVVNSLRDMSWPDKYFVTAKTSVFIPIPAGTIHFNIMTDPLEVTVLRRPHYSGH